MSDLSRSLAVIDHERCWDARDKPRNMRDGRRQRQRGMIVALARSVKLGKGPLENLRKCNRRELPRPIYSAQLKAAGSFVWIAFDALVGTMARERNCVMTRPGEPG